MAIKQAVELTGGDEVIAEGKKIATSLEAIGNRINDIGKTAATSTSGLQQYFLTIKGGSQSVGEHANAVHGVTDAYHILNPLLHEAGLGIAGFREWAMVARLGFIGLATAGVGAVITELYKMGEASVDAKQKLENAIGASKGQKLFEGLQKSAGDANTTVASLATGATTLAQAWSQIPVITGWVRQFNTVLDDYGNTIKQDLEGHLVPTGFGQFQQDAKDIPAILQAISKGMQAEGMKAEDADKATNSFLQNIFKLQTVDLTKIPEMAGQITQGFTKALDFQGVTSDMLAQFEKTAPLLSGIIEKHLTGGFTSVQERIANEGKITADDFIKAVIESIPEIKAATEKIPSNLSQTTEKMVNDIARAVDKATSDIEKSNVQGVKSIETVAMENKLPEIVKAQWEDIWKSAVDGATKAFNNIKNTFSQLNMNLNVTLGGASGGSTGGGSFAEPPFASGGLFRGRGGIDNNLIRVSDYEYIMNPSAVRKYGVDFMHMINAMQFPVRGFASGGLVSPRIDIPSSVAGSQSSKTVTFTWKPGGFGLAGSRSTIEALEREATLRGISAAGLAPGWVR